MNQKFDQEEMKNAVRGFLPSGRKIGWLFAALLVVVLGAFSGGIIEHKEADEILGIQSIVDGKITWYVGTESWAPQYWGNVVTFKKRGIYSFDAPDTSPEGMKKGRCLNGVDVRFNDGGHGTICGSIQFEMPTNPDQLTAIYTKFKTQQAVQSQLIETIVGKSIYLSGPLMSSRESYAEKRNNLLSYIEVQIHLGVYKTTQREAHVKDAITGQDKTATVVEIVQGKNGPERQEDAVLSQFGIKAFNFAIKRLPYADEVEAQIQAQQKIAMTVQTSMANAKEAEQRAITVVEQGKADAAAAKWKQEALKATAVTQAEQEKAVAITAAERDRDTAKLARDAAEFYKQQQVLKGEGDAAYRQKVMQANGALEQKLEAYTTVMGTFAKEFGKQKWVPEVQYGGGSGATGVNSAQTMMDVLSTKALRDLGIDMKMVAGHGGDTPAVAPAASTKK